MSTATRRTAQSTAVAFAVRSGIASNGGCCRICLVDVDAQRPRQGPQVDRFHGIGPAVVERQNGLRTPHGDTSLERPDLTVGELAGVTLLQFVED